MLANSQLIGGHTEYNVLCGLGVPSLRSLWGAVRNRLYILRTYCKSCISFNFQFFFIINTTYRQKRKKYTHSPQKKNQILFNNLYDFPQKKLHAFTAKKITRLDNFFVHDLHFSLVSLHSIQRIHNVYIGPGAFHPSFVGKEFLTAQIKFNMPQRANHCWQVDGTYYWPKNTSIRYHTHYEGRQSQYAAFKAEGIQL